MKVILKHKFDTVVVSEKFQKREFVATIPGEYPQEILFQLVQSKCEMIDNREPGEELDIEYNLRGREWIGQDGVPKWFNTIEVWKIQ